MTADIPTFTEDLYGAALLRDSYPAYKIIRDSGPAVWMPKRKLWAIGRFDDVRAALRADQILTSGRGVAANEIVNGRTAPITLTSDGDVHVRRRTVLIQPVLPAPLKVLRAELEEEADQMVAALANGEPFESVSAFASRLPVSVVGRLVGLDDKGRNNMLRWAAATFDALGAMNLRGLGALPRLFELSAYVQRLDRSHVKPGGWADQLFEAAGRGAISREEAQAMIIDYVAPALDTTILATAHMLWLLGQSPGAYTALRAAPDLVPGVVNEAVRLASPIRGFTRFAQEDYTLDGVTIAKGQRALILFASANRDERHYTDPDAFDIHRNPRDHVGWGHGPHTCVGMHLARLEMEILLTALLRRVRRISVSEPRYLRNNVLQGFVRLPAVFHPA